MKGKITVKLFSDARDSIPHRVFFDCITKMGDVKSDIRDTLMLMRPSTEAEMHRFLYIGSNLVVNVNDIRLITFDTIE